MNLKAALTIPYKEFVTQLTSGGFLDFKGKCVKAIFVSADPHDAIKKIRSIVLFLFDLNDHGVYEGRWNLPLSQFADTAVPGPQVNGYQVNIACKSLCSSAWHAHDLWDLPDIEGRQYLDQIKEAIDDCLTQTSQTSIPPTLKQDEDIPILENTVQDQGGVGVAAGPQKAQTVSAQTVSESHTHSVSAPSEGASNSELISSDQPLDMKTGLYARKLKESYQQKLDQLMQVQDQRLKSVKIQYQSQLNMLAKDYKERLLELQTEAEKKQKDRDVESKEIQKLEERYSAKFEQAQANYSQKLQSQREENEKLHSLLLKHQEFSRKVKSDRGEQALATEVLRKENLDLSGKVSELEKRLDSSEVRCHDLETQLRDANVGYESDKVELHQSNSLLEEKCQRLELQCDQLVENQEEHLELHDSLSKKHQELLDDYQVLSDKFSRLAEKYGATLREESSNANISESLQEKCEQLTQRVFDLEKDHTEMTHSCETWELKYNALQCNYDELQESFNELEKKKVNPYSNVVGINSIKSTREQLAQKDDELARRIAVEQRLRSKILSLNLQIAQLDTQSAEGFVEKLNELGVVSLASIPSGEHLTIMPSQLVEFVEDPIAFSALNTGVPESVYRAWLAHHELPICTAKNPDGSICGEHLPRVDRAADFVIGQSDRCDKHREASPSISKMPNSSDPSLTLNN